MLRPTLADLLKAIAVRRTSAHPKEIRRYDGMIRVRKLEEIELFSAGIAGRRRERESDFARGAPELLQTAQVAHNHVWTGVTERGRFAGDWRVRGKFGRSDLAIANDGNLNGGHRSSRRKFSHDHTRIGRTPEVLRQL